MSPALLLTGALLTLTSCKEKPPPEANGDVAEASEPAPAEPQARGVTLPELPEGDPSHPGVTFGVDGSDYSPPDSVARLRGHGCALLEEGFSPEGEAGARDLALVVGVGDYKVSVNGRSLDLRGPPNDAWKMVELLEGHFGFPAANVCPLTNEEATYAGVHAAFSALTAHAQAGDNVVIYFAGHGSQAADFDGRHDEPDGYDETLMLHDSRVGGVTDLRDDELNQYLAAVHATGAYVTLLLDSCNSGSASRQLTDGEDEGASVTRQAVLADYPRPPGYEPGDPSLYAPQAMERLVFVSAARDGTSAEESGGEGVFTKALLHAIQRSQGHPTWAQLPASVQALVAERSNQLVAFEGDLDRRVFTARQVQRPLSWEVQDLDAALGVVTFKGPALPGWAEGAVVDVYQGDLSVSDLASADARRAKLRGQVELTLATPFQAEGTFTAAELSQPIKLGDVALLNTPALIDTLSVRLETEGEGAVDPTLREAIRRAVEDHADARDAVVFVKEGADMRVSQRGAELRLHDSQGLLRNEMFPPGAAAADQGDDRAVEEKLAQNLAQHARQRHLLSLTRGVDKVNGVLSVEVYSPPYPAGRHQDPYCVGDTLTPAGPDATLQPVPACALYGLRVTLEQLPDDVDGQPMFPDGLHLAVVALLNDSSIAVLPPKSTPIEPVTEEGATAEVRMGVARPPLGAVDHLLVFGTPEKIDWHQVEVRATRGLGEWPDFGPSLDAWTASYVGVTVTADEALFDPELDDLSDPRMCQDRAAQQPEVGGFLARN